MKKSRIVSLVLVSTLGLSSCQKEEEDYVYMRGSEEDQYSEVQPGGTHGFMPYYFIGRGFSNFNASQNRYNAQRGGYETSSFTSKSAQNLASSGRLGYGGSGIVRGGFGKTGSHGFAS